MATANNKYEINFREYAVRTNGVIDIDATNARWNKEFPDFLEIYSKDQEVMIAHLDEVFFEADPSGGGTMPIGPAIISALVKAGNGKINTDTYQALDKTCRAAIDDSDRYYTVKGPSGGLVRLNDEQYTTFKSTGKTPHDIVRAANEVKKAMKSSKTV